MAELNPVFGDLDDLSEEEIAEKLAPNGVVHEITMKSYDKVPSPLTDEEGRAVLDEDGEQVRSRRRYEDQFHVICDIRAEKVVAALNKMTKKRDPVTGKMRVSDEATAEAAARMIAGVVVDDERQDFLDLLDDDDRAFAPGWLEDLADWIMATFAEEAGRPLARPAGSLNGRESARGMSGVAHEGRVSRSSLSSLSPIT